MSTCSNKLARCFYCAIVTFSLIGAEFTLAAEWSIAPGLGVTSTYDDNIWLSQKVKNQILDIRLEPNVTLNRESESSLISLNTEWSQKKYISNDKETGGLFSAELNAKKEFARQLFQFEAGYVESSTTNSETTGTTRELIETVKTETKLSPMWRSIWTPNFSIDLSFYYSNVEFEKSNQQWFDYRNISPSVNGLYQINENMQWSVGVGESRYELQDVDYTVDSLFIQTGVDLELNDNSKAGLILGAQRVKSELKQRQVTEEAGEPVFTDVVLTDSSEQFTVKANYKLELETANIEFNASRNITPTSQGDVQFTDRAELRGRYLWSENWSNQLSLIGEKRESVGANNATTVDGQASAIVRLRLDWQINEKWKIYLAYRWLTRKYESQTEWIDGHKVTLSTRYSWDKKVFMH